MIYLYVKTHNKTGLKYLGKTTQNPYTYKGSGGYWKLHIKKHGYDVTTEILLETNDKEKIKIFGKYYSDLWKIVESDNWANFRPETGDGGATYGMLGKKQSDSYKEYRSETMLEYWKDNEKRKQNQSIKMKFSWEKDHERKQKQIYMMKTNNPNKGHPKGKFWINDGKIEKQIYPFELDSYKTFAKGRLK